MSIQTNLVDKNELYNPPSGIVIRAGVIPFVYKDKERYYLLGLYQDNVCTDMGGGCKTSKKERPIDCLIREINEETDDVTAQIVINTLENPSAIEVWRQSADNYSDYGYSFKQPYPGPVYRYYVLLEIDDPEMKLGGNTFKKEVDSYRWFNVTILRSLPRENFSNSFQDFLITRGIIKRE